MVEAINKMFEFYRAKKLDMFKVAISLPGLAYKMLISCPNANFSLFKEEVKHLCYMLKNNIWGGPSIIFNRYQEVNKTLIRGNKLCKILLVLMLMHYIYGLFCKICHLVNMNILKNIILII